MARAAANGQHAVDNLLRNAPNDLPFFHAGEGLPQIIEAMKCRPAFGDRTAGIAFSFD